MRIIDDYRCVECDHQDEYFVSEPPLCNKCGGETKKVILPIRFTLEGVSGDFPTASDQWVKKRKQKLADERREKIKNGEPL